MDAIEIAGWQTSNPHAFLAIRLELPGETLRLTSGGTVVFGGETFLPEHPEFGLFSTLGAFEDGDVDAATSPDIGFEPFTDTGFADLTASAAQGSPFTVWWGLVDPATGAVLGAPPAYAHGYLNVSMPSFGVGARPLTLSTYTEEQFQLIFEGVTLGDHSVIARTMPDTTRKIYWRASEPYPGGLYGGGGGGIIGGNDGGQFLQTF